MQPGRPRVDKVDVVRTHSVHPVHLSNSDL